MKDELSSAALSKIPWRKNDVSYNRNEIYFDLVESLDVIISGMLLTCYNLFFTKNKQTCFGNISRRLCGVYLSSFVGNPFMDAYVYIFCRWFEPIGLDVLDFR